LPSSEFDGVFCTVKFFQTGLQQGGTVHEVREMLRGNDQQTGQDSQIKVGSVELVLFSDLAKGYTVWVNFHLQKVEHPKLVTQLLVDMKDGLILAALIQALSGQQVKRLQKNAWMPIQVVIFSCPKDVLELFCDLPLVHFFYSETVELLFLRTSDLLVLFFYSHIFFR
jgi:hypothetical protein